MAPVGHQHPFHGGTQAEVRFCVGAGEHDERRPMAVVGRPIVETDLALHPGQLAPASLVAQRRVLIGHERRDDAAAGHVVVVDQHETAGNLEFAIEVEGDRRPRADRNVGHLILFHDLRGVLRGQIPRVDDPMDLDHLGWHLLRRQPKQVRALPTERLAAEPEQVAAQLGGDQRRRLQVGRDLTALDEDLLVQRETDRTARGRLAGLGLDVELLDRPDRCRFVRWREDDAITDLVELYRVSGS